MSQRQEQGAKKNTSSSSSSSGGSSGKKPSKYHIKNKRHQQHQSARSNKHFLITGQMSGTGFRRRIATVNDNEEMDQEELLAIQQEEQMKRLKYGKRQLLDNSFRFKTEEEEEEERTPQAEEQRVKAKLQHELNRMEKETMMMISNSITLTHTFGSATSRGLLEWEETEKEDYSTTHDTIMRNLFYLDQAELAKQIKNPQVSLEERLDLIDICAWKSALSILDNNDNEISEKQLTEKDFIPIGQFLSGSIDVTSLEGNTCSDTVQDEEDASISEDEMNQQAIEPSSEKISNNENVESILSDSEPSSQPNNIFEKNEERTTTTAGVDILDEIVQESEKPIVTQRNNNTYATPFISSTRSEPVLKIMDNTDDMLDDLLSLSQNNIPSPNVHASPTIMDVKFSTSSSNSGNHSTATIHKVSLSTEASKQTNPVVQPKEETKDLDEWLDDLIN
ncbi:hypothetical protein FDP41_013680 [Naegleria fowleri]|uniref:Uncharacterized protein n=1 Tax=Naegleria fowleri TaxID=5763 RepID=A0A6A5BYK7_NAEFO|nr:uncharacterized protein FDP41_013680 [Naegleria fowleri]KAF0980466.1 hypothetical protein FDP41_013680 [Naegleria fowleri]CAG4715922.1 unnamed protein product [Naegleria fowleri]